MTAAIAPYQAKDYKSELKPIWCPGCGDFGVVQAIYRALAAVGRPPHETAFVSGIGCSSRIPGYTTVYGFNSVHGRALPIAQGIKLANPELLVLVAGGDGDGFSIGGGHVPHAVRRNLDLTYIVMDTVPSPSWPAPWTGWPLKPNSYPTKDLSASGTACVPLRRWAPMRTGILAAITTVSVPRCTRNVWPKKILM